MPDDRDSQRRHDERNQEQQEGSAGQVRRIAREVNTQMWNDVGVDVGTFQGRNEHARLLDFMRERVRKRDDIDRAHDYALKLKSKEQEIDDALAYIRNAKKISDEIGTETRKGIIGLVITGLISSVAGAIAAVFAVKGH